MCLAVSATFGADIIARAPGPDGPKDIVITTNDTTLVHLDWESLNGGGLQEVRGRMDRDSVVLIEEGWSIDNNIRTDTKSTTVVPTNKLPREVTVGTTKIEVFRVGKENDK